MKIKLRIFEELEKIDEPFLDLRQLASDLEFETPVFDALGEKEKKEAEEEIRTLLNMCTRASIMAVKHFMNTGDRSNVDELLHKMVVYSRAFETDMMLGIKSKNVDEIKK
ncbi:MAG: hypothetical protein WC788_02630 [Candidatus Paceibacterota bacterium]